MILFYSKNKNLWLIDVKSGEQTPLFSNDNQYSQPTWSPDGKKIAFVSNVTGSKQIHVHYIAENKRFQDNVTAGQVNSSGTRRMLSEQQIYYSFKNVMASLSITPPVSLFFTVTFGIDLSSDIIFSVHSWPL